MKNRIPTMLLCILLIIGFVGCRAQIPKDGNEDNSIASEAIVSITDVEQTEPAADTTNATETETEPPASSEPKQTEEKKPDNIASQSRDNGEKPIVSRPLETPPKQNEPTPPETAAPQPEPPTTEPIPTETEPPIIDEPKPTEPPVPAFHIDDWIEYAQEYAKKVEFKLDPTAIYCWDNPIRAHARCIYLERDIQGRLNIYAQDEDITCVWIWAEPVGKEEYDIFIGYA